MKRRKAEFMFSRTLTRYLAIAASAVAIGGASYAVVAATTDTGPGAATTAVAPAAHRVLGGGGSNARSGPAAGGSVGTVGAVSALRLTLSTPTGQQVAVKTTSSTTYRRGTTPASPSAIKKGQRVLVLGTANGTTITADQVIVQTAAAGGGTTAVVPFQRGAAPASKPVGQIPASYTQGSGTIVSGAEANRATTAALTAYPGGIVNRVVKLSNGWYEVHNLGVGWPHHIFVDQSFKVVGAS